MPFCGTLFLPIFQERMIKMKAKLRKELPYLLFILPAFIVYTILTVIFHEQLKLYRT